MFYGEYEHTIDEKSRLTLPARFRNAFAGGVVLARGLERNIDVFPRESWDANMARIAELDSLTREAREMKRYVFAGAAVAELDGEFHALIGRASANRVLQLAREPSDLLVRPTTELVLRKVRRASQDGR